MNAILGMTQLALEQDLAPEVRDYLETAYQSAGAMLRLVDDILDISKLESGTIDTEEVAFDLRQTLDDSLAPLVRRAREKGIEVEVVVATDAPDCLQGDPHRLQQIIANLFDNAIKFTTQGEVRLSVETLESSQENCALQFSVQDTGIGISEEDQSRVLAPFVQSDSSSTRPHNGSGMGLAISDRLVRKFGGRLDIQSKIGEGSRFSFTLQFPRPQESAGDPEGSALQGAAPSSREETAPVAPLLVLVVEDTPANQKVVKSVLSRRGHRVHCATNGREAINMAAQRSYDLILMDIQMPIMDGLEATAAIRSWERTRRPPRHTPIIAMTAYTTRGVRQECFDRGVDAYVPKPVDIWKMVETIESLATQPLTAPSLNPPLPEAPLSATPPNKETMPLKVDLEKALARLGGDQQLLREMIGFYLEDMPELLDGLKEAQATEQWNLLRRLAHSIKGLAASVDAPEVQAVAGQLEQAAQTPDRGPSAELVETLTTKSTALTDTLREYLSES